jgi:hypothetical protein
MPLGYATWSVGSPVGRRLLFCDLCLSRVVPRAQLNRLPGLLSDTLVRVLRLRQARLVLPPVRSPPTPHPSLASAWRHLNRSSPQRLAYAFVHAFFFSRERFCMTCVTAACSQCTEPLGQSSRMQGRPATQAPPSSSPFGAPSASPWGAPAPAPAPVCETALLGEI